MPPPVSGRAAPASSATCQGSLAEAARGAFALGEALDWRSYDRDDILLSPLTRPLIDVSPFAARVVLQIGRRSGWRVRRLLRIRPHEEPKALADFLQAAVLLARGRERWAASYVGALSERLRRAAVPTSAGYGWGVRYPWVSRFGTTAADEPNMYTTTVACRALLDAHELQHDQPSLDVALCGVDQILGGLGSFTHRGLTWLRYTAGADNPIVNIQSSAASLFARIADYRGPELLEAADRAAETVIASQRRDGSWTYSIDGRGDFVDGFHSGFTLEGLQGYADRRGANAVPGTHGALAAGLGYFKEHLLTSGGLPRGFADKAVSFDGQNVAQAIQTLLVCGNATEVESAARIWTLGFERLRLDDMRFAALRWSIGPFVVATARLIEAAATPDSTRPRRDA